MNVVHFVPGLADAEGGPSRSVPRLCLAERQLGADVALVFSRDHGALSEESLEARDSGVGLAQWDRSTEQLSRALGRAEVVHLHGIWSPDTHRFAVAAREFGKRVVFSPRGMLEPWARNHRRIRKAVAWLLYQRRDLVLADLLHATSRMEADHLAALLPSAEIITVPNGTDLPGPSGHDLLRRKQIVFLSRIHKKKGALLLVEAVARLSAEGALNGWTVVIAGPDEGGHAAEVKRRIAELGVDGSVACVGPVRSAEKWRLLGESSLFVLPSFSENFGIVVAEALAAGVPVITTTATPWEVLRDERCGWWIDRSVESLTNTLREALRLSEVELRTMGVRGRKLVVAKYSWAVAGKQMLGVYERMLAARENR